MSDFEAFYLSLLGELAPEAAVPGVENAFAPGSLCGREYRRMREAYERLCTRLAVQDEDEDLNTLIDALEAIQKDLCRRTYLHAPL